MADARPGGPEHQVVILCAVEFGAKSQCEEQLCLHHQEMADIVVGQKVIGVEIRLDIGLEKVLCGHIALVLIRIEDLGRALSDLFYHFIQGIRRKKIVVVQKSQVIAAGMGSRRVRVGGNAAVLVQPVITDPAVLKTLHGLPGGIVGAPVGDDQLKIAVGLFRDRPDHLFEQHKVRHIQRYQDADKRQVLRMVRGGFGLVFPSLRLQLLLCRSRIRIPVRDNVPHPLLCCVICFDHAVPSGVSDRFSDVIDH